MTLGKEKLYIALARKCWTVAELAKASGVSSNAIYILCNHPERQINPKTLGKLAKTLEVEPAELLEEV